MYCIFLIFINHGNVETLQSMLGSRSSRGTERLEVAYARCMLAALVDMARVDGLSDAIAMWEVNSLLYVV